MSFRKWHKKVMKDPVFRKAYMELLVRENAQFFVVVDRLAYSNDSKKKLRQQARKALRKIGVDDGGIPDCEDRKRNTD